jgi:hypothetical protein
LIRTWIDKLNMTWTSKVCCPFLFGSEEYSKAKDQDWLDSVNQDRKKEQLDSVTYEAFEIIMDRLEKEWFNLVRHSLTQALASH